MRFAFCTIRQFHVRCRPPEEAISTTLLFNWAASVGRPLR